MGFDLYNMFILFLVILAVSTKVTSHKRPPHGKMLSPWWTYTLIAVVMVFARYAG